MRLASTYADRLAVLGALVLLAATTGHRRSPPSDCRLATIWEAGDIHFNERLQFFFDGHGEWDAGGYAEEAQHGHEDFAWTESGSTLTFAYGDVTRTVRYKLERHEGRYCFLTFETNPFLGTSGFTLFSNDE